MGSGFLQSVGVSNLYSYSHRFGSSTDNSLFSFPHFTCIQIFFSPNFCYYYEKIIRKITRINPKLSTTGGTSDARFIRKIAPCLEFGLVNKTMHRVDECVSLIDLKKLTKIYNNILVEYFN